MTATDSTDPDGAFYAMAREVVGPDVPVVATVDLHANISERMVERTDAIISYLTNPHVDQRERAAEAQRIARIVSLLGVGLGAAAAAAGAGGETAGRAAGYGPVPDRGAVPAEQGTHVYVPCPIWYDLRVYGL